MKWFQLFTIEYDVIYRIVIGASQMTPVVKNQSENAWYLRDVGFIPGHENPLELEMTIHSSILAWRIPWTEELGGLQSIGSQRVRNNWSTQHACWGMSLPLCPLSGKLFNIDVCWILSKAFHASIERIIWFLVNMLMWYVTLICRY